MNRNNTTNTNRTNLPLNNNASPIINRNNNNNVSPNLNSRNPLSRIFGRNSNNNQSNTSPLLNRTNTNINTNTNTNTNINTNTNNRSATPTTNSPSPILNRGNLNTTNPNRPTTTTTTTTPVLNRSNPTITTNTNTNTTTTPVLHRSNPAINTNINNNNNINSPNTNRNNPMINTTNDNKDSDKSKNDKNEIETNWQDIVDKQIVGSGYLDFGCILDSNGKVLATKNINVNEEEAKQLIKDLKNDEKVLKLSNKKYNTMISDKQQQYYHGKEGNNGIFCLKTKSNFIIGHYCEYHHYDNPVAKKSQVVMETVAKTMKDQNL